MRAAAPIRSADIVFHDAAVGRGVLALAPHHVDMVSVGKRADAWSEPASPPALDGLVDFVGGGHVDTGGIALIAAGPGVSRA